MWRINSGEAPPLGPLWFGLVGKKQTNSMFSSKLSYSLFACYTSPCNIGHGNVSVLVARSVLESN